MLPGGSCLTPYKQVGRNVYIIHSLQGVVMKLLLVVLTLSTFALAGCSGVTTRYPVPYCTTESEPYRVFTVDVYADGDEPVTYDAFDHEPDTIHFLNGPNLANRLVQNGWSSPVLSGRYSDTVAVECHESARWS